MRALPPLLLALAACASSTPPLVPPSQPATEVSASASREDIDATEIETVPGTRVYYLVLLQRGPAWTGEPTPEVMELQKAHMANIRRLAEEGYLIVAGPFLGQDGPGSNAGMFIFQADTEAAVRELVQTDPAVRAGRFEPVILPVMAGLGLGVDPPEETGAGTGDDAEEPGPSEAELAARVPGCPEDPYRAFDFWVGDWEVRNAERKVVGHNTITSEQRGCVLVEDWRGKGGGTGVSLTYYQPDEDVWRQSWVAATGGVIALEGGMKDGSMVLTGTLTKKDGTTSMLRGTWTPLDDGRVRQRFEESKDRGKTWKEWFDGYYERR